MSLHGHMEKQEMEFELGNRKRKSETKIGNGKPEKTCYIAFLFTAAAERMRIFIGALYT